MKPKKQIGKMNHKKQFKILAFFIALALFSYIVISFSQQTPCELKNQIGKNYTSALENSKIQCNNGKCIATIVGFITRDPYTYLDPIVTIIGNETMNNTRAYQGTISDVADQRCPNVTSTGTELTGAQYAAIGSKWNRIGYTNTGGSSTLNGYVRINYTLPRNEGIYWINITFSMNTTAAVDACKICMQNFTANFVDNASQSAGVCSSTIFQNITSNGTANNWLSNWNNLKNYVRNFTENNTQQEVEAWGATWGASTDDFGVDYAYLQMGYNAITFPLTNGTGSNGTSVATDAGGKKSASAFTGGIYCINASTSDFSAISTVYAEVKYINGTYGNMTLTDTGGTCSGGSGDTIYGTAIDVGNQSGNLTIRHIWANDTFNVNGSFMETNYNITVTNPYGWLNISLTDPIANATNYTKQNMSFWLNASVDCEGTPGSRYFYVCGEVNGTAMYNASSAVPDTNISIVADTQPLYIMTASGDAKQITYNPQTCFAMNISSAKCNVMNFSINATGKSAGAPIGGGKYQLGVLFYSNMTPVTVLNNLTWKYNNVSVNITNPAIVVVTVTIQNATQSFSLNSNSGGKSGFSQKTVNSFTAKSSTSGKGEIGKKLTEKATVTVQNSKKGDFAKISNQQFTASIAGKSIAGLRQITIQSFGLTGLASRAGVAVKSVINSFSITASRTGGFGKSALQNFGITALTAKTGNFAKATINSFSLVPSRTSRFGKGALQSFSVNAVSNKLSGVVNIITQKLTITASRTGILGKSILQSFNINAFGGKLGNFASITNQKITASILGKSIAGMRQSVIQSVSVTILSNRINGFMSIVNQQISITALTTKTGNFFKLTIQSINLNTLSSRTGRLFHVPILNFATIDSVRYTSPIQNFYANVVSNLNFNILSGRIVNAMAYPIQSFNMNLIAQKTSRFFISIVNNINAFFRLIGFEEVIPPIQPPAGPGGGNGGGGGGGSYLPKTTPEEKITSEHIIRGVEITEIPILKEVTIGQVSVFGIEIENKKDKEVKVKIKVDDKNFGWVKVEESELILGHHEKKKNTVFVDVPENAKAGDYKFTVTITGEGVYAQDSYVLRAKSTPQEVGMPRTVRTVSVDYDLERTNVNLEIKNQYVPYALVEVTENVPKVLAERAAEIEFNTTPSEIIKDDPLVLWSLTDLKENEKREIFYSIKKKLADLTPYIYWPVYELSIFNQLGNPKFKLVDFKVIKPVAGETSEIIFSIKNSDSLPHNFKLSMELPQGWKIEPEILRYNFTGLEEKEFKVNLLIPEGTERGTYIINAIFKWDENIVIKEYPVVVQKAILSSLKYALYILIILVILIFTSRLIKRKTDYTPKRFNLMLLRERISR